MIDGRHAVYKSRQTIDPSTHYLDSRSWAHLPEGFNIREVVLNVTDDEWNNLMYVMSRAARSQPFSEPYLWQTHEKESFVRWIMSWRV